MTDRELMQMALDALMTCREDWIFDGEDERPVDTYDEEMVSKAFKALRVRLAQPELEPVAIVTGTHGGYFVVTPTNRAMVLPVHMALYAAPPQREWQGLTDEEIAELWVGTEQRLLMKDFARAIEAKLKEKNVL